MLGGYMGKVLWVDLATGSMTDQQLPDAVLRAYVGGYGLGARLLYDRIPAGADPLGADNALGMLTGPLTGTTAPTATRWTVVCKSPLTDGWGDANGSGFFAVALKQAGYDAVFFTGIASRPVYLLLDDGRADLRDASALWRRDCCEVEDWVKSELGDDVEAACVGPSGERLARIAGVVHRKGRVAARSGVGAVMGSKRLKMVAARGGQRVPVADPAATKAAQRKYLGDIRNGVGLADFYHQSGTPGYTPVGVVNGDSPTRNWGTNVTAFAGTENLEFEELLKHRVGREACWHCPLSCWGTCRLDYAGQTHECHQPEYETASAFGSMVLNADYPSIIVANDLCNRYGLDTISTGACVAFAVECFEAGVIGTEDTGGLELQWGDHRAMNALVEKIALREDIGDLLAEGVKRASERLGPATAPFAIHVGGQELPMHDPRYEPAMAVIYRMDATPGRHTQAAQYLMPPGYESGRPAFGVDPAKQEGRGRWIKEAALLNHTMNAAGLCLFGYLSTTHLMVPEFMTAVRGEPFSIEDMLTVGERIANLRQAFNLREGVNAVALPVPDRALGRPPLADGPTAGVTVDVDRMSHEFLETMGWTPDGGVPRAEVLQRLGLDDIARDLWA